MITPIVHRYDEVGSTNDIALEMARSGAPEGTVILARSQTKGRGRRGRAWFARPGESILMSVILRPDIPVSRYSQLAFPAAVAIAESLREQCGLIPALKWPNDVLVNERKIAGILVETAPGAAVVGIGLNVKQTEFPPELANTATSIVLEGGSYADIEEGLTSSRVPTPPALSSEERAYRRALHRQTLADAILDRLFAVYALGFEEILNLWRKYMWGLGRSVEIVTEEERIPGTIAGIDSDGALLIEQNGKVRRVLAADAIHTTRAGGTIS